MYHRGKKTTHLCGIFFIFSAAEQVSLQYHNCFISLFIQNLDTLSKHTAQCIIEPTWLEYCLMTREHCVSHANYAPDTAYIMKMCEAEDTLVTVWKHPESRCGMWLMIKRIFDFVHPPPPRAAVEYVCRNHVCRSLRLQCDSLMSCKMRVIMYTGHLHNINKQTVDMRKTDFTSER